MSWTGSAQSGTWKPSPRSGSSKHSPPASTTSGPTRGPLPRRDGMAPGRDRGIHQLRDHQGRGHVPGGPAEPAAPPRGAAPGAGVQRVHEEAVARLADLTEAQLDREIAFADRRMPIRDILWGAILMPPGPSPRAALDDVPAGGRHVAGDLRAEPGGDGGDAGEDADGQGVTGATADARTAADIRTTVGGGFFSYSATATNSAPVTFPSLSVSGA